MLSTKQDGQKQLKVVWNEHNKAWNNGKTNDTT
jgi:hypothetical protein